MDPNATLRLIFEALQAGDEQSALDHARALRTWLQGGGFPPNWQAYPDATTFYANVATRTATRFLRRNLFSMQEQMISGLDLALNYHPGNRPNATPEQIAELARLTDLLNRARNFETLP
jgi:hypothetical protein